MHHLDVLYDGLEDFHLKLYCDESPYDCIRGRCDQCSSISFFKDNINYDMILANLHVDEIFGYEIWEQVGADKAWVPKEYFGSFEQFVNVIFAWCKKSKYQRHLQNIEHQNEVFLKWFKSFDINENRLRCLADENTILIRWDHA